MELPLNEIGEADFVDHMNSLFLGMLHWGFYFLNIQKENQSKQLDRAWYQLGNC